MNNIEEVFEPKYLEDWNDKEYFNNVERPELELSALKDWESSQANKE